jgi:hypothetical protein
MVQHAQTRLPLAAGVVVILTLLVCFVCGCGANTAASAGNSSASGPGQSTTAPVPGENTAVTVLFSSTANDELTDFQLSLGTLTLTDAAGRSVTVFSPHENQLAEFMHSNSILEPATSVSIPQDVYTSATLTFSNPQFSFVTYNAGYIYFNTAVSIGASGFKAAQIALPSPITVSGQAMALVVDSEVSQSVSMSGSPQGNNFSSSVTPSFSLTGLPASAAQDASGVAQVNTVGEIASVGTSAAGATTLLLNLPSGTALTIAADGNTVYQGIDGYTALSPGTFADVDLALQPDGTLLATRVEVSDLAARDLVTGLAFNIDPSTGVFNLVGEREQGRDFSSGFRSGGMALQFTGNTQFRIDGGFRAPEALPFSPVFDQASIVAGQNVAVTSPSIPLSGPYPTVTTLTLLPQTVNGTVESVTSNNGFQVCQLSLAPYDPLSTSSSRTLEVYVGSQSRLLNSTPLQPGQVLRFHGMVFSAQGSLEMVADQVKNGVAE